MPTISIGFSESLELQKKIMVSMEVPIQEQEQIWVWDHYLSYVLHVLSELDESSELLDTLADWAKDFAPNMALSFDELSKQKLLTLSQNIQIVSHIEDCNQLYFIEISPKEGHWPNIHIKTPDDASPTDLRDSVFALAEFFLTQNQHFYRDLPLHMVGMRKFYQDEMPYSDEASMSQAPAYAFDIAFKFFQQLEQTSSEQANS